MEFVILSDMGVEYVLVMFIFFENDCLVDDDEDEDEVLMVFFDWSFIFDEF